MSKTKMKSPSNKEVNDGLTALLKINDVKWRKMRTVMRLAILHKALAAHIGVLQELEKKIRDEHKVGDEIVPEKDKGYLKAWDEMMDAESSMSFTAIPEEWLDEFAEDGDSPTPLSMAALLPFIELSENGEVH